MRHPVVQQRRFPAGHRDNQLLPAPGCKRAIPHAVLANAARIAGPRESFALGFLQIAPRTVRLEINLIQLSIGIHNQYS